MPKKSGRRTSEEEAGRAPKKRKPYKRKLLDAVHLSLWLDRPLIEDLQHEAIQRSQEGRKVSVGQCIRDRVAARMCVPTGEKELSAEPHSNMPPELRIDQNQWSAFFEELRGESDRATVILYAAWIDHLLEQKLRLHFSKGNAEQRDKLFDGNGAFHAFSSKVNAAFCLGWLDADVRHDIDLIRRIRNRFAHQIHGLSLKTPEIRDLADKFRIPHRDFHDWGKLRAAASKDGRAVILYTGDPPDHAGAPLDTTGLTFRFAASWVVAYLAANLEVRIVPR